MPPRITIISTLPDWCQPEELRIDEAELRRGKIACEAGQRARKREAASL